MLINFCLCNTGSKLTLTSSKMHQQMKLHGLLINTKAQVAVYLWIPLSLNIVFLIILGKKLNIH